MSERTDEQIEQMIREETRTANAVNELVAAVTEFQSSLRELQVQIRRDVREAGTLLPNLVQEQTRTANVVNELVVTVKEFQTTLRELQVALRRDVKEAAVLLPNLASLVSELEAKVREPRRRWFRS